MHRGATGIEMQQRGGAHRGPRQLLLRVEATPSSERTPRREETRGTHRESGTERRRSGPSRRKGVISHDVRRLDGQRRRTVLQVAFCGRRFPLLLL